MTPAQLAAYNALRKQLIEQLAKSGLGLVGGIVQGATALSKAQQVGCTPCQQQALAALAAMAQGGGR